MIRLQKALADRGVASRRHAEELIAGGHVRVDGVPVMTLGTKVEPDARIDVDGVATRPAEQRYVLLNKPRGIVSTAHDERGRRNVVELIGANERLYPVGRLDTDSEGMLLLTNDGEWAQQVLHPRFGHEREYDVAVSGELTPAALAQLTRGVRLEEGLARARVEVRSRSRRESRLRMVLHTGWRRQIRRMLSAVDLRTVRLVRVRIGPLAMGKLRTGDWRELTRAEVAALARPATPSRTDRTPRSPAPSGVPTSSSDRASRAVPKPSLRAEPRRSDRDGAPRARGPSAPHAPRSPQIDRARGTARFPRPSSSRSPRRTSSRPASRAATPRFGSPRPSPELLPRTRRGADAVAPQRTARPTAKRGRRPPLYGVTRGPIRARVTPR